VHFVHCTPHARNPSPSPRLTGKIFSDLLGGIDVRRRVEIGHIGGQQRDDRDELRGVAPLSVAPH
jgi:hypothetical protein